MNKIRSFTLGLLLVSFFWVSAHSQSSTTRKDYKVVGQTYTFESGNGVSMVEYDFKGSSVKTREMYFVDRKEQDAGLASATKNNKGCDPQLGIFNSIGAEVGRKIVCEDELSNTFVIAYSHFDSLNKVNLISGESRRIVEEFAKGICPYSYHLYPDLKCPGFD